MRTLHFGLLMLMAVTATGCGWRKQHLNAEHGKSYTAAFAAQQMDARKGGPPQAVTGLDSQEAAIISDGYRASLAPKGVRVTEEPMLIVAPQNRAPAKLAPSVPPKE